MWLIRLLIGSTTLLGAASLRADVHVAVLPDLAVVQPGQVFEVELTVTETGSAFNGYEAVIAYDPAAITFLPRSQAQQEGPLMTEACPNRFHVFDAHTDVGELELAHVLLCAGVSVSGPGVIYRLQFQAGVQDVTTTIRLLDGTAFYLAGTYVTPLHTADAHVQVGAGTTAPTPASMVPVLSVAPNPFNPRTTVTFEFAQPGWARLVVHDLRGRRVRLLCDRTVVAGRHDVAWDGRDDRDQTVESGVYLVHLEGAGAHVSQRLALVR